MSFPYPPKPWQDGQTVRAELEDGIVLIGVYEAEKNVWHFSRSTTSGGSGVVTTADVFTLNARPTRLTSPFSLSDDPNTVVNQQEANWWLFEDLDKRARKPIIQDTEPTIHPLYSTDERFLIKGDMWIDITNDELYWWDGSHWQNFSGDRAHIVQASPPTKHPDFGEDPLKVGDLWIDGSNILHYWTGTEWQEVLDSDHYGDKYVKKTGDTMTGELVMDNAGIIIEEGHLAFGREGTDVELSDVENRFSKIKSIAPVSTDTNTFDYSKRFGIKVDLDGGNTYKNNFAVGNRHGDIIHITGGGGPQIILGGNEFTGAPGASGLSSGVPILGVPTPSFEDSPGDIAVNKEYVDERDNILQQEIIELEEEIEAIAPSVERGSWNFTLSGTVSGPGVFTAFDEYVATAGAPIGLVTNIKSLWFHSIDNAGTPHGFDNVEPGNLLQLFVEGEEEYGLFEVVEVHDFTDGAGDYWVIDVDFVRTLENTTRFDNSETCRLKIFQAPEGGTADGFVMKSGDSMSGALKLENTRDGLNFNPDNATAKLTFENTKTDGTKNSVHIFQSGSEAVLVTSGKFKSKNNFYTSGYLYGWSGGSAAVFHPRVRLVNYTGTLMYDTNVALLWNENGVRIPKLRGNAVMGEGFTVQGAIGDNYSATHDVTEQSGTLLEAFHNSNSTDAVNYYGRIIGDKNITTKEYVDGKIARLLAKIEELELYIRNNTDG